jgi:phospholipid transport system substrate-binding protein
MPTPHQGEEFASADRGRYAMLKRRAVIGLLGAAALLVMSSRSGWNARAQPTSQAVSFVKSTSERLAAIANSDATPNEKRFLLEEVVNTAVDENDIARFCLGRFWLIATADQKQQYLGLFHDLLVTKIAAHFGEYRGVRVIMGPSRTSADTEIVITTVERPDAPATQVDWVVSTYTGSPKIFDVLAGGTSMRLTQSSDFASYLAHHQHSVDGLIEGMRQLASYR